MKEPKRFEYYLDKMEAVPYYLLIAIAVGFIIGGTAFLCKACGP